MQSNQILKRSSKLILCTLKSIRLNAELMIKRLAIRLTVEITRHTTCGTNPQIKILLTVEAPDKI
jgi:hypothetical protein